VSVSQSPPLPLPSSSPLSLIILSSCSRLGPLLKTKTLYLDYVVFFLLVLRDFEFSPILQLRVFIETTTLLYQGRITKRLRTTLGDSSALVFRGIVTDTSQVVIGLLVVLFWGTGKTGNDKREGETIFPNVELNSGNLPALTQQSSFLDLINT
jgi:hypothetical protein